MGTGNPQRQTEVYGFVGWVASGSIAAAYLVWAFSTDETLFSVGIAYFPSRYWALAIPAFLTTVLLAILPALAATILRNSQPLSSVNLIFDQHTKPPAEGKATHPDAIPPLYDIPISVVNSLLYHDKATTVPTQARMDL